MAKFAGKVAFISGGRWGIGRSAALALAEEGADIAINDIVSEEIAAPLLDEIRQLGRRAIYTPADVSKLEAVEEALQRTVDELGSLDIAVANAVYSDRHPFHDADMDGFRRTIDVTMWGALHVFRGAAQRMIASKTAGSLVLISSPHAHTPAPNAMAYNMAKAATAHMARTAAIELAKYRIRVNGVEPGWTDTPGERKFTSDEAMHAGASQLPAGRLAQPEEIARGVVFLCDPASEYITGSTLSIDGGVTLPWWASRGMVPE